jgi:hypothetical protein
MNDLDRLRAWSYCRQHLDRSAPDLMAALERVLAVHSTHPPAPLSLLARTAGFAYDAFDDLVRQKRAISLPAMRGSVHLIPTVFAPWIFAATRAPSRLVTRRFGVDPGDPRAFDDVTRDLLPRLRKPVEGSRIKETLGITDREFLAVRLMSRTGQVVRIPTNPRSDRLLYVATEAWLGAPLESIDPAEARRQLARAYFDAFGPARLKDFAWWFSASLRDARAAVEGLGLAGVGDGLLLPREHETAFRQIEPLDPAAIAILPKWDSYTMGYAPDGRRRFVDDRHLPHAYTTSETKVGATTGDGLPLVLRGGRAVATWSHRFSGKTMTAEVTPFPGESVAETEIAPRFAEIAALFACERLNLVIHPAAAG